MRILLLETKKFIITFYIVNSYYPFFAIHRTFTTILFLNKLTYSSFETLVGYGLSPKSISYIKTPAENRSDL